MAHIAATLASTIMSRIRCSGPLWLPNPSALLLVGAEPGSLMVSVPSFPLGVVSERLFNRVLCLVGLWAYLFGCFQKS